MGEQTGKYGIVMNVPEEMRPNKLITLSVGHVFGEVIKCSVRGESVGELFEFWPDT